MNRRFFWLTLILLAAFALRVHALGVKSLWYDELRQVEAAQHSPADFPAVLAQHAARPLDYVLTHYLLLGGHQEFWLRFPPVLWGTLSVALTWPLARRWFDRRTGTAAMALMVAAPIGVQYAQELRPYALYLLFSLASLLSLERALGPHHPPGRRPAMAWVLFGLASVGGMLTHYFYVFVLAAQGIYVAVLFGTSRGRLRWTQLLAFAGGALAGLAALFVGANSFTLLTLTRNFLGALAQAPASGLPAATFARGAADKLDLAFFTVGILPFFGGGPGAALIVFNALALIGLGGLALHRPGALILFMLWLFLGPGMIILYLQYRQEFFADRYLLFVLPVYLLAVAYGLTSLTHWLPFPRACVAVGLLVLLAWDADRVGSYYHKPKDDWRRLGAFLAANVRPGDAIAAPDVQAFIRFYAPGQPGTIVDANDLGPQQEALEDAERFWFVLSDYTLLPLAEQQDWARRLPGITIELDPKIQVIYVHPGLTQAQMEAEARQFVIPPPSVR